MFAPWWWDAVFVINTPPIGIKQDNGQPKKYTCRTLLQKRRCQEMFNVLLALNVATAGSSIELESLLMLTSWWSHSYTVSVRKETS